MKILVTGASGQLGFDCVNELVTRGYKEVLGVHSTDFDLISRSDTINFIKNYAPDVIIHCAAYTNVDGAEKDPATCFAVNTWGTKNIVDICKETNIKLIFISTDFVFDGKQDVLVTENDSLNPLNVYGKSKQLAEVYIQANLKKYFIVRTAWLCGINGNNFIKAMLKLAKNNSLLEIVDDQFGAPTFTADLSKLLCDMVESTKYGVYHATNEGYISKADFAKSIFELKNMPIDITKITTDYYNQKYNITTQRPMFSNLSKEKLTINGFNKLPNWQDSLKQYLKTLEANDGK